jgi:GT2 family glycosyltransferase
LLPDVMPSQSICGGLLAFVNPDIYINDSIFTEIIRAAYANPGAGAFGPMLLSSDNSYQSSTGFKMGFWYEFLEAFMLIKVYRMLDYFFRIRKRNLEPITVNWVSGAFMVIKKEIFECLNGFDENFFLNYEDIDLCTRINEKGYTNYYLPYIKCFHSGLSSQGKDYEKLVINRYESRLVFAQKHYGLFLRTIVRVFHILGLVFRILILMFVSNTKENKQRSKGYRKSLSLYLWKKA